MIARILLAFVFLGLSANAAQPSFLLGADVLVVRKFVDLRGKRVGLLTNPSGVNRNGRSTVDLLHRALGAPLDDPHEERAAEDLP